MYRKSIFLTIFLLSVQIILPQTAAKNEVSDELKKEAAVFLRETAVDVNSLRTLENRIGLSSELASLMWFNDEKEARAMFQNVINDFRQLITSYESQMNASNQNQTDVENYSLISGSANQPERKFGQAIGVRQQIARAIAEHDPQLAFEFFSDTGAAISNPAFRQRLERSDAYFEARLLNQIAEKNIDTALKYGRKTLSKNFNLELLGLLKKIYNKDAEKGAAFGEEIGSKLKSEVSKPEGFYFLTRVLDTGAENLVSLKGKTDKRPMFSEQILRDLADLAGQELLKRENVGSAEVSSYLVNIEKFAPARAVQIRQKFEIKQKTKNSAAGISTVYNGITMKVSDGPATESVKTVSIEASNSPENQARSNQNKLGENIKSLDSKTLSGEERQKIVEQSRKIIAESPNREQRKFALTALAIQVAKLGDKELASDLMNEVQNSVNLQPKNYREFLEIWMLAGSYAQVDAQKAFPILENSIFRLNDTIGAFIKIGEFMDVSGEIIADGEIQVGSFGGEMVNGLLRDLGASDTTVRSLAIADFARTKDLTNKFDRTEVRILAKMLVLRGIFANAKSKTEEDETGDLLN